MLSCRTPACAITTEKLAVTRMLLSDVVAGWEEAAGNDGGGGEVVQEFLHSLAGAMDCKEIEGQLTMIAGNQVLLPKLLQLMQKCSWEVVDTVFAKCNNDLPALWMLVDFANQCMSSKEWEIIIFEKVYSCDSVMHFNYILYGLQLLLIDQDNLDAHFRALRAIDNFLRKQFSNPYDLMSDQELSGRLSSYISSSLVFICSVVSRTRGFFFSDNRMHRYDCSNISISRVRSRELSNFISFLSRVCDLLVSNLSTWMSEPILQEMVIIAQSLVDNNYSVLFSHLSKVAIEAQESILTRSNVKSTTAANDLHQLHVENTKNALDDILDISGSLFPFHLPWKFIIAHQAEKESDLDDEISPLPLLMSGLASLLVWLFTNSNSEIPSVLNPSYIREQVFAGLTILAAESTSKGDMKAVLFLKGFERTYSLDFSSVVSLKNLQIEGNELFFEKLAPATLDNFRASVERSIPRMVQYFVLCSQSSNHWHLSQRLLDLLASCSNEALRKSVYIALRGYFASFEPNSRLQLLSALIRYCPHSHIKVLLIDTAKDFCITASSNFLNSANHSFPRPPAEDSLVLSLKEILCNCQYEHQQLECKIKEHPLLRLASIADRYENGSEIEGLFEEYKWKCCCNNIPVRNVFWSPWALWKFWLDSFNALYVLKCEDFENSVDFIASACNFISFFAIKLASNRSAARCFFVAEVPELLNGHKVLSEVLITLISFRLIKLPQLAQAVLIQNGQDSQLDMKIEFLMSVAEFTSTKLAVALKSIFETIDT